MVAITDSSKVSFLNLIFLKAGPNKQSAVHSQPPCKNIDSESKKTDPEMFRT
jgi:hypothetical protein